MTKRADAERERAARLDFKVAVLAIDRCCLVHDDPDDCDGDFEAHHVVTQQQLRHHGLSEHLWDPRNGMTVCELAHRRHTRAIQRIPYDRLPSRSVAFARELGVDYLLDRYYPRSS